MMSEILENVGDRSSLGISNCKTSCCANFLIVQQLVAQISQRLLWMMGIVGNLGRVKV